MSIFQKIAVPKTNFSNYNFVFEYKCSMNMADLVPINVMETLPNDTFSGRTEAFVRFAPMKFPVMHRVNLKLYHFFVPNRILWNKWADFIAEKEDDNLPAKPYMTLSDFASYQVQEDEEGDFTDILKVGGLADYLGMPVDTERIEQFAESHEPVDLLPFLAYQKIWNDYFRDQNLQDDIFDDENPVSLYNSVTDREGEIPLIPAVLNDLFRLRKKAWEKDYFTSALPEPQFGDPVPVPIVGAVTGIPHTASIRTNDGIEIVGTDVSTRLSANADSAGDLYLSAENDTNVTNPLNAQSSVDISPVGEIGQVVNASFTINDLRLASSIQRLREAMSRAGHRYKETIMSLFNQNTPDYRLDRPEFIASETIPVQISDIPQTSSTISTGVDASAQGQLAGKGVAYGSNNGFKYHCQEHGFIITLATVIPRSTYQDGLSRMFTRMDRYDYYNPYFENLGEQEILNKEIFLSGNEELDNETFGYAPRYSEYKYMPSTVHGDFRDTLDFMHLGRQFDETPTLNGDFIVPDPETTNRAFAVTADRYDHLYCEFVHHLHARRPMSKNPLPQLI